MKEHPACFGRFNQNCCRNAQTTSEYRLPHCEFAEDCVSSKGGRYIERLAKIKKFDEYFMSIMEAASKLATCDRGKSAAVIVKNGHILATGYVGAPKGLPHCDDAGHLLKKVLHDDGSITEHCVRTVHAEQNAICMAAKLGHAIDGATLYCRMTPCRTCAMMIINCGIVRVVSQKLYQDGQDSIVMFEQAGVTYEVLQNDVLSYKKVCTEKQHWATGLCINDSCLDKETCQRSEYYKDDPPFER